MIKYETRLGSVLLSSDYFTQLVGQIVSECFGVSGLVSNRNITGGSHRGVAVRAQDGCLEIDLHIAVSYGVNILAIGKSITSEVKYLVEESTGFPVAKVQIFVDEMN